jgi:CubicO group peptidase (beta-lactamase class C family)
MRFLLFLFLISCSYFSYAQSFFPLADSIRKARGIPGIAYAVFRDNQVIDMGVTGFRKYRTRDSLSVRDRFHIGTNSFAIVSWIAGKMVETGKIKWTATFVNLFPEQKSKLLPQYAAIDLKSLLSNTAGLRAYKQFDDYASVPAFNADPQLQRKDFAIWMLQRPGLSETGDKKMVESIPSYTVAVVMLERASGLSWEKLVETYLNKPFGISVKFGWPNSIAPTEPWGHWSKYGGLTSEPGNTWVKQHPATLSSSGMNLSVVDYTKFLQDELKGLRGGKAQLSQRTLDLIHFGVLDYAFGWDNGSIENQRIASHTGESYLFSSYVELIPEKNIGILVVCNNGDSMGKGAVINLCRLIRDNLLKH